MARITGNNHSNTLRGTHFSDLIRGKGGHDTLKGKAGHDKLHGDSGNDVLIGGKGHDKLWGGPGADIFKFNDGDGFFHSATSKYDDVIYDFQDGIDKSIFLGPTSLASPHRATRLISFLAPGST